MTETIQWPQKTREIHNHHMDSTIWNTFEFRDDDIIIGTFAKAGTTWMQQIVGQLLFNGDASVSAHDYSPWLELRVIPAEDKLGMLAAQNDRRFIKTHLPLDALVFHPQAKYLYVARDLPDIVWSLHNHLYNATEVFYEMINDTPGRVGPPCERPPADVYAYWRDYIKNDGVPMWSFWENIRTWWAYRDLPNMKLVHFNDLKRDLPGQIRDIAAFLDITPEPEKWDDIIAHCTFDWMKANAEQVTPMAGDIFEGGAGTFINKGTNRRWKDILTEADYREYLARARQELGEECTRWLTGGSIDQEQAGHA